MVQAAAVFDARVDSPQADDRFFVDTNVWRYFTYAKFTTGDVARNQQMVQSYSAYISLCLKAKSSLYWSPLSYSELAHLIEDIELDIYNDSNPTMRCSRKEYRLGSVERLTVVTEMQIAWAQIEAIGEVLPTPTDDAAFRAAVTLFERCPLDGYDIFYVNAMRANGISAIVTDDIDFIYVPGLSVFTANEKALRQAKLFKKAATR